MLIKARAKNAATGITGALLFTGTHFIQTLEGGTVAVDPLMAAIERDRRHTMLSIIDRRTVSTPNFGCFSMAYSGISLYISRMVSRALPVHGQGRPRDVNRLLQLMRALETLPPPRP